VKDMAVTMELFNLEQILALSANSMAVADSIKKEKKEEHR